MKLLKAENINNILFLDIETAPNWEHFKDVPEDVKKEWIYKFKYADNAPVYPDVRDNPNYSDPIYMEKYLEHFANLWKKKAGLHPEFSEVICISMGFINDGVLRLKSISGGSEGEILAEFLDTIASFQSVNKYAKLCAHYGKGFDYPFISKRLLFHRFKLPFILDTYGVKPWDMASLLDTQEIWKMGGFGSSGTLSSIAMAFGIPTPKDDIDGADVSRCYNNGEIERIVKYCEKDVVTLVNVFKAMRGEELLNEGQIQKTML
ncbi:MAG: 3'-5' exonuclease [Bacteroidetes bacterium]|nr:3'-5' exonuclease [Bacteroidota bacterium]